VQLCELEAQVLASLQQLQQQQPQLGNGATAQPAFHQPLGGAPGLAATPGSQSSPERRQQQQQQEVQQRPPLQQTPQPAQSQARPQQVLMGTPARKGPAPGTHTAVSPPGQVGWALALVRMFLQADSKYS